MTAGVLVEVGALDVQDVDGDSSGIPAEDLSLVTTVEEAGNGTADPAAIERELRLERLRSYHELLEEAGRTGDRDSLARAADLAALYDEGAWVFDMADLKRKSVRGRPVDPKSRSRFATWAKERTGLAPSTIHQLLRAHEVVSNCLCGAETMPTGEWALRPLTRLLKEDPEAIERVWNAAVAQAGGAAPEIGHVKAAIRAWKKRDGSGTPVRHSYGIPARERQERIVAEARFLAETGHIDELRVAFTAIEQLVAADRGPS